MRSNFNPNGQRIRFGRLFTDATVVNKITFWLWIVVLILNLYNYHSHFKRQQQLKELEIEIEALEERIFRQYHN